MFKLKITTAETINTVEFNTELEAQNWLNSKITQGCFPQDIITEIVDATDEIQAKKESDKALAYLNATDYLIIREMDAGTPCPVEVKQLRAAARLKVI